jgi:beta-phosphoglucomutase
MARGSARTLGAAIFDVDGVLVASPHERAWRTALQGFADPARFTTAFYQEHVAGKPRLDGAVAALTALGVPDAEAAARAYAVRKQSVLQAMIAAGDFAAFDDAVRLAQGLHVRGLKLAAASSSKNAAAMMRQVRLEGGGSLADLLDADLSGRDVPHGKPAPDLFLAAAAGLKVAPADCVVIEDAPAGIEAARAGGMAALGVARLQDVALLEAAGADLVVTTLDQVDIDALVARTLRRRTS